MPRGVIGHLDLRVELNVYGCRVSRYRISQLAERSGVPASTLRFYEQARLLPAGRTPSGYRIYDDSALERLRFIASAKHLGLGLEEIRELLGCGIRACARRCGRGLGHW